MLQHALGSEVSMTWAALSGVQLICVICYLLATFKLRDCFCSLFPANFACCTFPTWRNLLAAHVRPHLSSTLLYSGMMSHSRRQAHSKNLHSLQMQQQQTTKTTVVIQLIVEEQHSGTVWLISYNNKKNFKTKKSNFTPKYVFVACHKPHASLIYVNCCSKS